MTSPGLGSAAAALLRWRAAALTFLTLLLVLRERERGDCDVRRWSAGDAAFLRGVDLAGDARRAGDFFGELERLRTGDDAFCFLVLPGGRPRAGDLDAAFFAGVLRGDVERFGDRGVLFALGVRLAGEREPADLARALACNSAVRGGPLRLALTITTTTIGDLLHTIGR